MPKFSILAEDGIRPATADEATRVEYRVCAPFDLREGPYGPHRQPSFCCDCGGDICFDPLQGLPTHCKHICTVCMRTRLEKAGGTGPVATTR